MISEIREQCSPQAGNFQGWYFGCHPATLGNGAKEFQQDI